MSEPSIGLFIPEWSWPHKPRELISRYRIGLFAHRGFVSPFFRKFRGGKGEPELNAYDYKHRPAWGPSLQRQGINKATAARNRWLCCALWVSQSLTSSLTAWSTAEENKLHVKFIRQSANGSIGLLGVCCSTTSSRHLGEQYQTSSHQLYFLMDNFTTSMICIKTYK